MARVGTALLRKNASSAFLPSDLSGLHSWFESDGVVYQDSARTTLATADGDPVGSWSDASGGSRHAGQGTSARRMTLKTNLYNGKAALRADGVDDYLDQAVYGGTLSQPNTMFVVVKHVASADKWVIDGLNSSFRHGMVKDPTNHSMYAGTDVVAIGNTDTTTAHVWTLQFNGASSVARKDGVAAVLAGNPGSQGLTGLRIGAHTVPVNYTNSDFLAVLLYTGAKNSTEMGQVETYLKNKYGTP